MQTDPLTSLLALLRPQNAVCSGFQLGGDWSVAFRDLGSSIKCYVELKGHCYLQIEEEKTATRLNEGDCIVMPTGKSFILSSNPTLTPTPAETLFRDTQMGEIRHINDGDDFLLAGNRFEIQTWLHEKLASFLPAALFIKSANSQQQLRAQLDAMMREIHDADIGSTLVAQNLAHIMLIQAMRYYMHESHQQKNWFAALSDKKVSKAIIAIHNAPAATWSLVKLAHIAGMSRSVFADKFKALLNISPMQYVTWWRMLLACDRLQETNDNIITIANDLGYASDTAFSTAFKRTMGKPPAAFRRDK